jgi:hypothetical protein
MAGWQNWLDGWMAKLAHSWMYRMAGWMDD